MSYRNYFKTWLQLSLVILFFLPNSSVAQEFVPGRFWNKLNKNEQLLFIIGFKEGYYSGGWSILRQLQEPYRKTDKQINVDKLPDFVKEVMRYHYNENLPKKYDMNIIRDIVTQLYKDPVNSYIEINEMIDIAIDKLKGKSKLEIDKKIEKERKRANALREMNKENPFK